MPKIYCIGILAKTIFPHIADYHNVAVLRNEKGELIDDQTAFITVELAKFKKKLPAVQTDLDKLLYTMKTLHKVKSPKQFPPFWTEEWLEAAIKELDTKAMTPEQRLAYEMTISANALAIKNENKKIERVSAEVEQRVRKAEKTDTVLNALQMGLTVEQAAKLVGVSPEFVDAIRQQQPSTD